MYSRVPKDTFFVENYSEVIVFMYIEYIDTFWFLYWNTSLYFDPFSKNLDSVTTNINVTLSHNTNKLVKHIVIIVMKQPAFPSYPSIYAR